MSALDPAVFLAPGLVLVLALVAGAVLAWRMRPGQDPAIGEVEALQVRHDQLLAQLRELEADRDKLPEAEYASRRAHLVREAAEVLRNLDAAVAAMQAAQEGAVEAGAAAAGQAGAAGAARAAADAPPARGGGLWKGFLLGSATAGVAALLVWTLVRSTSERGSVMTGGGPAGAPSAQRSGGSPPATPDPQVQAWVERLERDPQDLQALNGLAHRAIQAQDLRLAMKLLDDARRVAPDDPEVRVHLAALRLFVGMNEQAEAELKAVLERDPRQAEALLWLAVSRLQQGDEPGARELARRVIEVGGPEERAVAQGMLQAPEGSLVARFQRQQAEAPPHPPVGAAAGAGAGPGDAVAGAGRGTGAGSQPAGAVLSGTVRLAEGATPPPGGVLFLYVRTAPGQRGPPAAAQRHAGAALPLPFTFTAADLIRGGAWPPQVWLQARYDADGDPMTRSEADLLAPLVGPLEPGANGVELVLGGA